MGYDDSPCMLAIKQPRRKLFDALLPLEHYFKPRLILNNEKVSNMAPIVLSRLYVKEQILLFFFLFFFFLYFII